MAILIVVNNPHNWPLQIPNVEVVSARSYLTDVRYSKMRNAKVFNLCRSYRYQSTGYYVSLLAGARGHRPLPNISTIQDMKSQTIIRFVSDDLDELIQKSLKSIQSEQFTLSIYFGRNVARRYDRLSLQLFNLFQAPLLRAEFTRGAKWQLHNINPISGSEIPPEHRPFIVQMASHYFHRRQTVPKPVITRYDLAILYNPEEKEPPSEERAVQRFVKAAEALDFGVELVTKDDYARLAQFDALFIRETTSVNHHTYRFARRAQAEGLIVVDDPESILKCTNKVYLEELLARLEIPTPKTRIVHRDNLDSVIPDLGLPCVLKQPDSSFSQGVIKVKTEEEFRQEAERLLERSELILAQEFLPTAFDWRIGIFDRQVLYACKYFMAGRHWQIIQRQKGGTRRYGKVETVPIKEVPAELIKLALRSANAIGDGLYGVDIKEHEGRFYVIEVNDNPNIDAGNEDSILKDGLYTRIMQGILQRIEKRKRGDSES